MPASMPKIWRVYSGSNGQSRIAEMPLAMQPFVDTEGAHGEGTSMQPRLENDERIFVNKFEYSLFNSIKRGDIVVFWYPEDPTKSFIKRVIGLPDDSIDMDGAGHITINGRSMEESYLAPERNQAARLRWNQGLYTSGHQVRVKPHYYFVMGDNRDASNDSRSWGLVPEKYIYGKAMFRYWPLPRIGSLNGTVDVDEER